MPPLRGFILMVCFIPRACALGYYHIAPTGLKTESPYVEFTLIKLIATLNINMHS
jgi:hypothetical protein